MQYENTSLWNASLFVLQCEWNIYNFLVSFAVIEICVDNYNIYRGIDVHGLVRRFIEIVLKETATRKFTNVLTRNTGVGVLQEGRLKTHRRTATIIGSRRARPFSLPLSWLLTNLRMTSIITVMKLGRDSESGVYRTFHNLTMSPKRWRASLRRRRARKKGYLVVKQFHQTRPVRGNLGRTNSTEDERTKRKKGKKRLSYVRVSLKANFTDAGNLQLSLGRGWVFTDPNSRSPTCCSTRDTCNDFFSFLIEENVQYNTHIEFSWLCPPRMT